MRNAAVLLLLASALCGCMSIDDVKEKALANARQHCAAEGKQLVGTAMDVHKSGSAFDPDMVTVKGYCVGPGEPGYVKP